MALRYSRALSRAPVARSRGDHATPIADRVNIGDQLFYWRGTCATPESAWASRWHGPAVVIGIEGGSNVWVSNRGTTTKRSGHHIRPALPEEIAPWDDLARAQPDDPRASMPKNFLDSLLPESALSVSAPLPGGQTFFDMTVAPANAPKRKRDDPAAPSAPQEEHTRAEALRQRGIERPVPDDEMDFLDEIFGEPLPQQHEQPRSTPQEEPLRREPQEHYREQRARLPEPEGPPTEYGAGNAAPMDASDSPEELMARQRPPLTRYRVNAEDRERYQHLQAGEIESLRVHGRDEAYIEWMSSMSIPSANAAASSPSPSPHYEPPEPEDPPMESPPEEEPQWDRLGPAERQALKRDEPGSRGEPGVDHTASSSLTRRALLDDVPMQLKKFRSAALLDDPLQIKKMRATAQVEQGSGRRLEQSTPVKKQRAALVVDLNRVLALECNPTFTDSPSCRYSAMQVCLVGVARSQELQWDDLDAAARTAIMASMAKGWTRWEQFNSTKYVSAEEYEKLQVRGARAVGTWRVLTQKGDGSYKARLVVQGCQEISNHIRGDAPTGSQLALHITMAFASQEGWCLEGYDAASAFLHAEGLDRLLLLQMLAKRPPPGILPSQILRANSAIYGAKDAGRSWYLHLKKVLETDCLIEMQLERCLYIYFDRNRKLVAVVFTHVDDFIIERLQLSPEFEKGP